MVFRLLELCEHSDTIRGNEGGLVVDMLITGVYGQLGRAIEEMARARGLDVVGHDVDTLDITSSDAVIKCICKAAPKVVVNCAAVTKVDACESEEAKATAVNGTAVGHLAAGCNRAGALLVQVSTDYVFPGDGDRPYQEDDPTAPLNAYGRSKLAGEKLARTARHHLIVRTAWLFGRGGPNFIESVRRQVDKGRERLAVVADQHGCPTFCDDLAAMILDLIEVDARGIVHAVSSGSTTWHGLAYEVIRLLDKDIEVIPITTENYPLPARRPRYSVLSTCRIQQLLGEPPPAWNDALARYLGARETVDTGRVDAGSDG